MVAFACRRYEYGCTFVPIACLEKLLLLLLAYASFQNSKLSNECEKCFS
jgi:hypothetical protein